MHARRGILARVIELTFKTALSYLLGSLVGSLIVGHLRGGVDIRMLGSGNAGATNALRTQGKTFALLAVLIDIGKGWLATRFLAPLAVSSVPTASQGIRLWLPVACGAAVILGHIYPLWYGFRGGKGAATVAGSLLGLAPLLLVPLVSVWLMVIIMTGYVGLASMTAAVAMPLIIIVGNLEPRTPLLGFGIFVAVLVVFTHRTNVARMRAGTEPRAQRLWLFRPRPP